MSFGTIGRRPPKGRYKQDGPVVPDRECTCCRRMRWWPGASAVCPGCELGAAAEGRRRRIAARELAAAERFERTIAAYAPLPIPAWPFARVG